MLRYETLRECLKYNANRHPPWEDLKQALNDKKKECCNVDAYKEIHFDRVANEVRYGYAKVE